MDNYKKTIAMTAAVGILLAFAYITIGLNTYNFHYFFPLRVKKVLAIVFVSYAIGTSSMLFQTITNNKILTPSVIGLDSLYLLIQTLVVYFFGSKQLSMMNGYGNYLLSIVMMMALSGLLFLVLYKRESRSVYFIVLAGMVIGGLFNGLSTFMQVLLDPNEFSILQGKMFASFNNINSNLLGISGLLILLTILWNKKTIRVLDVVSLGREMAINLGIDYYRVVQKELLVVSILVAVSTALVGPITFLGILVVSIARNMMHTYKHKYVLVQVSVVGFVFLMIGLVVVEKMFNFGTTISVIINFIGGIYFIYLMIKESKE